MEYGGLLNEALLRAQPYTARGKTATYIGELSKKDPSHLGIALCGPEGRMCSAGYSSEKFTMQSISKVVTLIAALEQNGAESVFSRVGMEPTGDAFNSMVRLDLLSGSRPFNPMINAGAIAVADCIRGNNVAERVALCLDFARKLTRNPSLSIDQAVLASEKATGYKNRAIVNLLESNGVVSGSPEEILELYFSMCSISADCRDLACLAAVLAGGGTDPFTGERLVRFDIVRLVRSLMVTCGMYDYSGEFASTVGIPSKSGVGGGIISAAIGKCGIAVYGPALDSHGNSVGGLKMLEYLSDEMDLNMF
jgi:glutaminase